MTRRRRRTLISVAAAAVAATVTAALLTTAPTASADVGGPTYGPTRNGADPHITRCIDPATPDIEGYCMVTSSDMGQSFAYPDGCEVTGGCLNYYPMKQTYLYYSPDGLPSTWVDKGVIARETDIVDPDWVPANAYHQWAPSLVKWGTRYYLYVPNACDITDVPAPSIHDCSRIGVWRSPQYNPFGPYEYRTYMADDLGYMSDPDVLVLPGGHPEANMLMIWATGVPRNCGEFKTAWMDDHRTLLTDTVKTVTISGLSVLGKCDPDGPGGPIAPVDRPYVEGASLYKFDDPQMPGPYTLVFPVKPDDTNNDGGDDIPKECKSSAGGPNNANSVIAYATATNPQGPYTYKGIIMCGSTTEWTNQATITKVDAWESNAPYVIAYHDSPASIKERKIHAECLFAGGGKIAGVYRQPQNAQYGFNTCVGTNTGFAFSGLHIVDPEQASKPTILTAPNAGADPVALSRYAVGPWERFKLIWRTDGTYVIQSLANNKYLCSISAIFPVTANCTSQTATGARFSRTNFSDGSFQLFSVDHGKSLNVNSNGLLYADSTGERGDTPALFTEMHLR
jgi:hypothetical protein